MVKVFIGELLPDVRLFPILNRQLGKKPYAGKKAYRAVFDEMDFSFITLVNDPADADFLLIPYNYFSVKNNTDYLSEFIKIAEKYNKKIILFACGDFDGRIVFPHAIIFYYAGYMYQGINENEIIIPAQIYAGDILREDMFSLRDKKDLPTVGFCGWAANNSFKEKLKYVLKILFFDAKKYFLFDKNSDVHKQGLYFRKKAIQALKNSHAVKTLFLLRDFYAANKNTIQGDPTVIREEYIRNIIQSDFVLCPRGDGNYSTRFYETLALGRIPVLIDTDCILPLDDVIDYRKFVVFVPHTDIKNTDTYIRKFWDAMDERNYREVQMLARNTFFKYLKFDSFLKFVFEK